ncbi:sensor histidine kinase [Streptomyces sp. NPDC060006]|uniref:sensor histidine kinase n=1 Tax=unclassified Streptomyces TaxID=2593676 RepID=UPI00367C9BE6
MRIARELHEVVAHAQADTAAHLASTDPVQSQKILANLTATASSAWLELHATVGTVRQVEGFDPDSLEPSPDLDRLPELISACEAAGLEITITAEGEPRPLSPGVDLTVYRIIQEALTHATKHASDHAAHVQLAWTMLRPTAPRAS